MKDYELTVVFHPDLEMNIDPALDKVKKTLESSKAIIKAEEVDGKKRLAYKIGKQEFGIFYYFELQLPAEAPAKISSVFNISDEILRYLLVKADPRKAKLAVKRAEKAEKVAESEGIEEAEEPKDSEEASETDTNDNKEEA